MGKEEHNIEELVEQLKDEDEEKRGEAIEALILLRDKRSIEPLTALMKETPQLEREDIIRIIGGIGGKEAVEPLIFALTDGKYDERLEDSNFRESFEINEELTELRIIALEYLEIIGDNRAQKPLIKIAKDKKEEYDIRKSAVKALGKRGDKSTIEPLRTLLNDSDTRIRSLVADILEKLSDTPNDSFQKWLKILESGEWKEVEKASKELSKLKDWNYDRINRVINVLNEISDVDLDYNIYAPKVLLEKIADDRIIDILIQIMEERDYNVKMWIIDIFKNLKNTRTIDSLVKVFSDPQADEFLKEDAVRAIANLGEPAVESLVETLKTDNLDTRYYVINTLGWLKDKRVIEPIIREMDSQEAKIRYITMDTLVFLKDFIGKDRVIELLLKELNNNKEFETSSYAADILGNLKAKEAVVPLIDALTNSHYYTIKIAALALGEIGDKRATEPLITLLESENDYGRRVAAAEALGELDDKKAIEPLINALKSEDHHLRNIAGRSLYKLGEYKHSENTLIEELFKVLEEILKERSYVSVSKKKKAKEIIDMLSKSITRVDLKTLNQHLDESDDKILKEYVKIVLEQISNFLLMKS